MAEKLIPKEESRFAQDYLEKLQRKDLGYVKRHFDRSIKDQVTDEKLLEIANYFPRGELIKTQIIGSQVNVFNSEWQGNFSFEYQFSDGWALANVVLKKSGEALSVVGFNVYRTKTSQKELNRFIFTGKSVLQYLILVMAVAAPLIILVTMYFCFRTPIHKRKWLWILFILVGVGSVSVNWTTGQIGLQLLSLNLLSASAMAAGPYSPWIISASIPIGAIVFWFKRKGFIEASRDNSAIDADS
jgi:hypothetical protein